MRGFFSMPSADLALRALVLTAAIGAGGSAIANSSSAATPSVFDVALPPECDTYCYACDSQTHINKQWNGPEAASSGFIHFNECFPGTNCSAIHSCGGSDDFSAADAWEAVISATTVQLAKIIEAHPERFHVNVSRAAVQILDCDQQVFAHLPMSAGLAAALSDGSQ
jgi:hypothetical protein